MNRGFGIITVCLVLTVALCAGGTAVSRGRKDCTRENERYALLEDTFRERTKAILEERGFRDSGVTLTWTREGGGARSYRVEIHHRRIDSLEGDERERLTESLRWENFCREVESFIIVYTLLSRTFVLK